MPVARSSLPTAIQRRAAQHLEDIRGTRIGTGGDRAVLADEVVEIHRPDLDDVAYYEFTIDLRLEGPVPVLKGGSLTDRRRLLRVDLRDELLRRSREVGVPRSGRGFLVLSADAHDHPLPHWSLEMEPPSRRLAQLAEGRIARIQRVDALTYVAEDGDGQLLAILGELPALDENLPPLEEARRRVGSVTTPGAREGGSDEDHRKVELEVRSEGPEPHDQRIGEGADWRTIRERYARALAPLLEDLRDQAAHSWEVEQLIQEHGEGIMTGSVLRVALLAEGAVVEARGPATSLVETELIDDGSSPPVVEIRVPPDRAQRPGQHSSAFTGLRTQLDARTRELSSFDISGGELALDRPAELELDVRYPDGTTERLRYFVVSPDTPSSARGTRLIDDGGVR